MRFLAINSGRFMSNESALVANSKRGINKSARLERSRFTIPFLSYQTQYITLCDVTPPCVIIYPASSTLDRDLIVYGSLFIAIYQSL